MDDQQALQLLLKYISWRWGYPMTDRKQIDSYKNPLTGEVVEFRHGIDASPPVSWAYLGSTSPVTDAEWERARQAQLDQRIEAGLSVAGQVYVPESHTPIDHHLGVLPEPRCSDTDRARYSARIDEAFAVGMITKDEWEARQQAVTGASTFTDLARLVTDIPEAKDTGIPAVRNTGRVTYVSKPEPVRNGSRKQVVVRSLIGLVSLFSGVAVSYFMTGATSTALTALFVSIFVFNVIRPGPADRK